MLAKIRNRLWMLALLALSLTGCSAIRGIGDSLANAFRGFTIHLR